MNRYLKYEVEDGVARITLDRPERLNAFSIELYEDLFWSLVQAEQDEAVEIVVITGSRERAFSSGGDLKDLAAMYQDPKRRARVGYLFTHATMNAFTQIEKMSKTVIARINGLAHGAGGIIAVFADFAIAVQSATIRFPEPCSGIADPYAASRLPFKIGMSKTKEILLTGEAVTAERAEAIGLIYKCVPSMEELDIQVASLVARLRATDTTARGWVKEAANSVFPALDPTCQIVSVGSESVGKASIAFSQRHASGRGHE
ncbi:enoyl-CoA hydratase/isomerase family protein [Oceanibacterium hippocampi]|uniref:1,4-Dihydroxy-2-naphthoyl-CoA synthase n=1 Tax=Oceanibacterium hippocampi TaxID=745714 RepID=A0A1Y5TLE5_9PROT|nr:enoyl-CoA hydratase/isomerase family protein [Oceanibacterium hippocampi]SLN66763.1 1,4-Dihydroxy-2-naphthoyl-CoA synthase [Oceanibacterium hippocampi]